VRTIENELNELEGVNTVEISLQEKRVQISYENENKWDEIVALLHELNYPPQ
jgi:copper chaperone CopZ